MMDGKNSFVLYADIGQHLDRLTDEEAGQLFKSLVAFASDGTEPTSLSPAASMAFSFISAQITRDTQKWLEIREKRRDAGHKGGVAKSENSKQVIANVANANFDKQDVANVAVNVNAPATATVNVPATVNAPVPAPAINSEYAESATVLPPPAHTPTPNAVERHKYGDYGWVKLTDEEYSRLVTELGPTELARCIDYLDTSAQSTGNKNRWKDWNLVIRRCHREGWGMGTSSTLTGNGQRQKSFSEIIAERTGSNRPSTNPFLDLLEAESQQQADDKYDLVGYFEKMEDGKK